MRRNRRYLSLLIFIIFALSFKTRLLFARTVDGVIKSIGPTVRPKVKKPFTDKGLEYPPKKLAFVVVKNKKILEVWGKSGGKDWAPVKNYPIIAASGYSGPKLRQGDNQVPEGIYNIIVMNPNSKYHLSMKLNYPNSFDKEMAKRDKRTNLGGDIFIHGSFTSVGCLAMGNSAIEELFLLVNDVKRKNVRVIIVPYDFRNPKLNNDNSFVRHSHMIPKIPGWLPILYEKIRKEIKVFNKTVN